MSARAAARGRPFRPRRWALLLLLVAAAAVVADLFLPAGLLPPPERRTVRIERGQTVRQIAGELKRVGLLRGTFGFEALARMLRLDRRIKAGQYSFRLGTPVPALLRSLALGMSGLNLVTIPEGLTMEESGLLLARHLGVPSAAFDSLGHDRAFLDSLGIDAPTLEGYLAPETYEFLPGTLPEVAYRTMARRQFEVLRRAAAGRDSLPLGLSLHQALVLASIVEAEAVVDAERPRIARVYLNRLGMGMRLQADPTVAYSLGMSPRSRLYLRQLRTTSPYNTYLVEGLPPGPICSPGPPSIEAVFHATPGGRDLFFVARGDGRHFFARSYEEHLANIQAAKALQAAADSARLAAGLVAADSGAVLTAPEPSPDSAGVAPEPPS